MTADLSIFDASEHPVTDGELEHLLRRSYVDGGFTSPERAASMFGGAAVRARGQLLFTRDPSTRALTGMVIVVRPDSPARLIAGADEIEMHLLAVSPEHQGAGLGAHLVQAALDAVRREPFARMVLWTQPTMHAAHRLYERAGFVRAKERDMERHGRAMLVYVRSL